MAEGLAAISLAGNIIQFISFTSVLVSKTKELHQSASGALNENVDLDIISEDIKAFNSKISSNAASSERLHDIACRCDIIAKELQVAIAKLQHKQYVQGFGNAPTRWQSFRVALKGVWGKAHVEELKARLALLRDQVMMHLVSDTSDSQTQLMSLFDNLKRKQLQAAYNVTAQIQALSTQLQATKTSISGLHDDTFWKTLHNEFSRLSSNVQMASQRHKVIASLRYGSMQTRQSAIRDAHRMTFSWIFSDRAFDPSPSNLGSGFTQWLQCGSGIYWITGKPGSGKSTLMKYLFDHSDTIRNLQIWSREAPLVRSCFYFWLSGQQMEKSLEGLLQTLLHDIILACPELIPTLCPERWDAVSRSQLPGITSSNPWTFTELRHSLALLRTQTSTANKFYFQVDGLDEYHGDSWEVIETLRDLSTIPNVKLCLSSRPWNCFQDSFGQSNSHVLRLHDFTRRDIELFARDHLLSYGLSMEYEQNLFNDFVRDIGERAQGVFLWVRLVVRSLREGIINTDSINMLRERLYATPKDLEEFFEQILGSVEHIYRSRMAITFLAALKSPRRLKLIHYYFLEQEDITYAFNEPSKKWQCSEIQRCATKTKRRLNGRFKGLLETPADHPQNKVDFLHRTLTDFLATKRMQEKLQSWALPDVSVFTAISRALIAISKFIDEFSPPSAYKLAIELASKGVIETGITAHCYEVIDQAELESERMRPSHAECGLSCYILRFAASIGHAEYLTYRIHRDGATLNLNRILKHVVSCPLSPDENYIHYLPPDFSMYTKSSQPKTWHIESSSEEVGNAPLPSLVAILLDSGADPSTIVDGASSWTALTGLATTLIDGSYKQQWLAVVEMFLAHGVDVNVAVESWVEVLYRKDARAEDSLRNTLRCFKCLFSHGLDPNLATRSSTLTKVFFQLVTQHPLDLHRTSQEVQHDLLRDFLRNGADLCTVYEDLVLNDDKSPRGWFQNMHRQLETYHQSSMTVLIARSSQYRIFLEHGLDPNVITHRGSTFWEGFLEAMHSVVEKGAHHDRFDKSLCDIILASLQYGADPYVPTIRQLLESPQPFLSRRNLDAIDRALQKEISQRESQTRSQCRQQVRSGGSPERGVPRHSKNTSVVAWQKTFQAKKRDRGDASNSTKHNPKSKRVRFG